MKAHDGKVPLYGMWDASIKGMEQISSKLVLHACKTLYYVPGGSSSIPKLLKSDGVAAGSCANTCFRLIMKLAQKDGGVALNPAGMALTTSKAVRGNPAQIFFNEVMP